jgi:platelet-activating factor acetylhydrolase IB subunit beta/gamma
MYKFLLSGLALITGLSSNAMAATDTPACNPFEVAVMTTPAPSSNPLALAEYSKLTFPESTDVIFLGDSIGVAEYYQWGFDKKKDKYSSKFLFAYGGDQFQMSLYKLLRHKNDIAKMNPKLAFVFLGSNSISYSSCAMSAGIENYLNNLHDVIPNAQIVVMSVLPRGVLFGQGNKSRTGFNNFLEENAERLNYKLVRFDEDALTCGIYKFYDTSEAASLELGPSVEEDICGAANMAALIGSVPISQNKATLSCRITIDMNCENFKTDNTHPTDIGGRKIVDMIKSQLKQELER